MFGVGMNNFHIVSIKDLVNHNGYLQVFNEIGLPALSVLHPLPAQRLPDHGRHQASAIEKRADTGRSGSWR